MNTIVQTKRILPEERAKIWNQVTRKTVAIGILPMNPSTLSLQKSPLPVTEKLAANQLKWTQKRGKTTNHANFRKGLDNFSICTCMLRLYYARKKLRIGVAQVCDASPPFSGEVEVDESCFGARRVRGKKGRGAGGKTIVLGILER